MSTTILGFIAVLVGFAIAVIAPRWLANPAFVSRHPRRAMLVWLWTFVMSSTLIALGLLLMIGVALLHHVVHVQGHGVVSAIAETILGWVSVALLGTFTFHAGAVASEMQSDRRSFVREISTLISAGEPRDVAGMPTRRIEWAQPIALATHTQRQVIYSSSLEDALSPRQLCAVIAHEWAHITCRHNRLLAIGRFASTVVPDLAASKKLMQIMRIATELEADDIAAGQFGADSLAQALAISSPIGIGVEERIIRLRSQTPTPNI